MADRTVLISENILEDVADSLRQKSGDNILIKPSEFAQKISNIAEGGGQEPETCTVTFKCSYESSESWPSDGAIYAVMYTAYEDGNFITKNTQFSGANVTGEKICTNIIKNSIALMCSDTNCTSTRATDNIKLLKTSQAYDYKNNYGEYVYTIKISGDGVFQAYHCFLKGTQILLSDKSVKPIELITYKDQLLVWDFDNGCYATAHPLWIKKAQTSISYYECIFSDGTILKVVGGRGHAHRIYCLDTNRFEYANDCIGKMVMSQNGPVRMESCEIKEEKVEFYNIITDYHMNLYANGILSSTGLSNIYPIEDMKYIIEKRELIPIEAFDNCSEKYYYGLRLGEQKEYTLERLNEKLKGIQSLAIENGK